MASRDGSRNRLSSKDQNHTFTPMLYNFRVPPPLNFNKFTLQQPFATLFDNLITVLWSVYGKKSNIRIGVNQLQWALEFMRVMRIDYSYPENIGKIVGELEDQLIGLHGKIGFKIQEQNLSIKKSQEKAEEDKSISPGTDKRTILSFNEGDVMGKLGTLIVESDPISGDPKYLKDLNAFGRQKPKDRCDLVKPTKSTMIGKLQNILNKTAEEGTKSEVQELIRELKVKDNKKKT